MLSYVNLGKEVSRLGNQLFQYAFLRTQAEKLGIKFYCPKWIGDEIFELGDQEMRINDMDFEKVQKNIQNYYKEDVLNRFSQKPVVIKDNTDISGYFESEKCFDKNSIKNWYKFKEDAVSRVRDKYKNIGFNNSIAMHLRLGDKFNDKITKDVFYVPRMKYYRKALELLVKSPEINNNSKTILVFSDDIESAKRCFIKFKNLNLIFIEGNRDWEDLYIMSQCYDTICGASTFSWWAGYLNKNANKTVVFPKECLWRPGFFRYEQGLIPNEWVKIKGLYPIIDNYFFIVFVVNPFKCLFKLLRGTKI
jgi:hypothetical protein